MTSIDAAEYLSQGGLVLAVVTIIYSYVGNDAGTLRLKGKDEEEEKKLQIEDRRRAKKRKSDRDRIALGMMVFCSALVLPSALYVLVFGTDPSAEKWASAAAAGNRRILVAEHQVGAVPGYGSNDDYAERKIKGIYRGQTLINFW